MTLAQWCEMACMAAIPFLVRWLGLGPVMFAGLIGWAARNAILAAGPDPAAVVWLGVPLHGLGYAWFSVVAAVFVDREAPPHLRASAQGIITFASSGAGVWAGNTFAGLVVDHHRAGTVIDWQPVWLVPLVGSAAALVVFAVFFRSPPDRKRL